MKISPPTHRHDDDRGVVSVEFVLIFPFLFALLMAIGSFGNYFSKKVDVTSAARDAARTLALSPATSPSVPAGWTLTVQETCSATEMASHSGNAEVTFSVNFNFSIPFVPLGPQTISQQGRMRCGG